MNIRISPWILLLAMWFPATAHAQRITNPQQVPTNVSVGKTIGGVIAAKDYEKIVKQYGPIKCNQIKVTVQDKDQKVSVSAQGPAKAPTGKTTVTTKPGAVPGVKVETQVESPSVPQNMLLFQETVSATGNNLGLGCKYSVRVPDTALGVKVQGFQQAHLWAHVEGYEWLIVSPSGWQNPLPLPASGLWQDMGRNFVVEVQPLIK